MFFEGPFNILHIVGEKNPSLRGMFGFWDLRFGEIFVSLLRGI